jgi:antitoxin component YwqK of YwqJK toxin-antitoxin module
MVGNGKLKEITDYELNLKHGVHTKYDNRGEFLKREIYQFGKLISVP